MRIVLVTDAFLPLRSSVAVQLGELVREFGNQGHELVVLVASQDIEAPWLVEDFPNFKVMRLKALRSKDAGYIRRTIAEILMPFYMLLRYRRSPLSSQKWDGIIWYSPSIFHGPFVRYLKKKSGCRAYLIIRDIFPEWAYDLGLMGRLPYYFFRAVAKYQYAAANIIGVQTKGNLAYFDSWATGREARKVQVLQNWLGANGVQKSTIRVSETVLAGKKIFVYAGNMGVAQGMDIILALAERMAYRQDVGFLFVGRGSEVQRLKKMACAKNIKNTLFFDEIHPEEIPDLYTQCSVGVVSLDKKHKSHNIPGKFITYMQCGLPVLASINPKNDLIQLIEEERIGKVSQIDEVGCLEKKAIEVIKLIETDSELPNRCRQLFYKKFTVKKAVHSIVCSLQGDV